MLWTKSRMYCNKEKGNGWTLKNKLLDIIGFINIILIIYIMIHSQINYVAAILAFCISFSIFTFLFLKFFDDSSVVYLVELYAVTMYPSILGS